MFPMTKMLLLVLLVLLACNTAEKKDAASPATTALEKDLSFRAVADMNDCHFTLKKDGSFEFYRLLFDSIKNSSYTGNYTLAGDTLMLMYDQSEAIELLGPKALIDHKKNEITFFDSGVTTPHKIILQ